MPEAAEKQKEVFIKQFLFLICLMLFASQVNVNTQNISAMSEVNNKFAITDVMQDLQSSNLNGKAFDINDYPFDENGEPCVINFVEYCYSYRENLQGNFGLYVYIYNPALINIVSSSNQNKIQMAITYENNQPIDYAKISLQFCSMSDEDYAGLFYKFKIDFMGEELSQLLDRFSSGNQANRQYDISGIELLEQGKTTADECKVGFKVLATGFARGYGANLSADSTLIVTIEDLQTVAFDVNHTYYRYPKSSNIETQISSAYFAVDNQIFEYYGFLQRIKAEWYEYKTKDFFVTSDQSAYDLINPYLGEHLGNCLDDKIGRALACDYIQSQGVIPASASLIYNRAGALSTTSPSYMDILHLMFLTENISKNISGEELFNQILNYNKSFEDGTLEIKDGSISADLFQGSIDENRIKQTEFGKVQRGYSYWDFDYGADILSLDGYNPSFWEHIKNNGLLGALFNETENYESIQNILPIYELSEEDFNGTSKEIADSIFIDQGEVLKLKTFYDTATAENKKVILFRFATSEYETKSVTILESGFPYKIIEGQGYFASQTVFMDFDIIQLTFKKDDIYKVIPAVTNPIDIISDLTPPQNLPAELDLFALAKWIGAALLGFILFLIFVPFIPWLIALLFNLIMWPVKLVFKLLIFIIFLPFKLVGKILALLRRRQ